MNNELDIVPFYLLPDGAEINYVPIIFDDGTYPKSIIDNVRKNEDGVYHFNHCMKIYEFKATEDLIRYKGNKYIFMFPEERRWFKCTRYR